MLNKDNMQNKTTTNTILIIVLLIVVACCCLAALIGLTAIAIQKFRQNPEIIETEIWTNPFVTPSPEETAIPAITPMSEEELLGAQESLDTLNSEIVPVNDPIDLAERLQGKSDIPDTLPDPDMPYQVGDKKTFWVSNTDTTDNFQVDTVLRYVGDHLYFWIEEGVDYQNSDLQTLAQTFDDEIYPTNQEFFGEEWLPGVDHDPRLYILYCGGIGYSTAGYYSSADELHPDAHMYSNAHEMFIINSDTVGLDEDYIYGTLAHEFQHMIHWYKDRNEETWVNEGFSMLAELINDFDPGGFEYLYLMDTDMQLTYWGEDVGENGNHYGASLIFMAYFMDRFGEEATKAFVAHPENGLTSIDTVMRDLNIINPDTSLPYTGVEVFSDWAIANYLVDSPIEGGRYAYQSMSPIQAYTTKDVSSCPSSISSTVSQYGVDYIEISCPGDYTLTFTGTEQVGLIPVNAYSGSYFFWSNMGDESNMRLSREFDLTNITAPINLSYHVWYDLEEDYDYLYLSAREDGQDWQILNTPSCTTTNPSGNSYGCGYNGSSNGWIEETVDLSQYAGKVVTLQFDYVTDAAVNGVGLFIDDISLEALNYSSDLEVDEGGWQSDGFVRIMNALPQTYQLSLITMGQNTVVNQFALDENNSITLNLSIDQDTDRVILVISGSTPYTRQKATYQVDIK